MKHTYRFFFFFLLLCPLLLLPALAVNCPSCGKAMISAGTNMPPSCTRSGLMYYFCPDCQTSLEQDAPAPGHDYEKELAEEPTCTEPGLAYYTCTRCQDSYEESVSPLGHSFSVRLIRSADCTHEGAERCSCTRCDYAFNRIIEPLGHEFELAEEVEASCTEDGYRLEKCTRRYCEEEQKEVFPALGHDFEESITEPTCTQDGEKRLRCRLCGEEHVEVFPAAGHDFGDWVILKEPTRRDFGEEARSCRLCSQEEKQALEKLPSVSPVLKLLGAAALAGGAAWALLRLLRPAAKAAEAAAASGGLITLQMKTLLLCWAPTPAHAELEKTFKSRAYLDIKKPGEEKLKPALVIFDADSPRELQEKLSLYAGEYPEAKLACLAGALLPEAEPEALKAAGKLLAWSRESDSSERKLLRLVAPLYSFGESKGLYAENATLLTDALGLPFLSVLLNLYVVGGDVKEAIAAKGEQGTADWADMVNDVAGLLGLDVIGNVAEAIRVGADQKERTEDKKK